MANFRQVHTKIWKDEWFLDLEPEHKLFFVYLFTNERASISGIYELARRVMVFESGVSSKDIDSAFEEFNKADKAFYQDGVVWVRNLRKYHETKSPKVQEKIKRDVSEVRECKLKGIYCDEYGIDRVSIPPYTYKSTSTSNSIKGGLGGEDTKPLMPLPVHLGGEHRTELEETWFEWQVYQEERTGKALTKATANAQFQEMYQWGPVTSIEAIKQSIKNNWQGLFEPKSSSNNNQPTEPEGFPAIREVQQEMLNGDT